MNEYLEFAKDIAFEAGKIMNKYFYEDNGSSYKEDNTIVTKADKEINSYLIEKVKEKYPDHCVDGEEEQFGKSSYVWVCDPVDGTAMYARHIPVAVFSLALVIDGSPKLGVVYDPFLDNLYYAVEGQGAYRNNEKIFVNKNTLNNLKTAGHFDMWNEAEYDIHDVIKELNKETYTISIGSAVRGGICVANGDLLFTIYPGSKHKNCDIAAVKIIVEEAGGKVTNLFGEEQRYDQDIYGAIVSNGVLHDKLVDCVKRHIEK